MFGEQKKFSNRAKTLGAASQNGVCTGGLVRMDFRTLSIFSLHGGGVSRKRKRG